MECPHCLDPDVVPIVYGMVTGRVLEIASQGRLKWGGTSIGTFDLWYCRRCKSEWGDPGDEMIDPVMHRLMTGTADPKGLSLTAEALLYIETVEKTTKDSRQ